METETVSQKTENYLAALEESVDQLILICEQLEQKNDALQVRQTELLEERDALAEQNQQLRTRIETMVARLKGLEHFTHE